MDGISMNTTPSSLYANQTSSQGVQRNDEQNTQQPGQNPPSQQRVNEGSSTVTTFSSQALELSQQDRSPPVDQPGAGSAVNGQQSGQQTSAAQQSGGSGNDDAGANQPGQGRSAGFETPSGNEARRPLDSEVTNDILRT